ncbi:hypothetical protein J2S40_004135 [Nocardioides luteus]|uniref:Uncharacterized protein n=1 Tax=Nocardioides luteus TaxID=1844 RepID=A0ABQ5SRB6_9ACTN|nr:hypothetical protein [Nocardioides luteus]MDR7313077.1 hypothetical protein [Nocardioides luteus]GGR44273.1 hypothetical protein GCM10010197_07230 [Nocardioides luteus]GLJ66138.1 hypothetical protein GCM10017579_01740 [Nocardioides luteus]
MNPLRRSYEARVLVVPLGPGSAQLVEELLTLGVEGVQVLTGPDPVEALTEPLGEDAWMPPAPASTTTITESADMVVLVGTDLTQVPEPVVREVCTAAREGGDLIAAVLVAPEHWEEPAGASAMVTLRQEVDMLVSVRGPELLAALLDVLRGGARTEDHPEVAAQPAEVSA